MQARLLHTAQTELLLVLPEHWPGGMYSPDTQVDGALQFTHVIVLEYSLPEHAPIMYFPEAHVPQDTQALLDVGVQVVR